MYKTWALIICDYEIYNVTHDSHEIHSVHDVSAKAMTFFIFFYNTTYNKQVSILNPKRKYSKT